MKKLTRAALALAAITILLCAAASATAYTESSTGGKIRTTLTVGLAVPYSDTRLTLSLWGLLRAFQEEGYLDGTIYNTGDPEEMWSDACESLSGAIQLLPDACFSLGGMTHEEKVKMASRSDIDLLLVFGTTAGKYVKELNPKYDVMVIACDDPVGSGIVQTEENGDGNFWAVVRPERFSTQMSALASMNDGKKFGFILNNDDEDPPSAEDIESAAEKYNFEYEIVYIDSPEKQNAYDRYKADYDAAAEKLRKDCDIFVMTYNYVSHNDYHDLFQQFIDAGIDTCCFNSEVPVKYGACMSVTMSDDYEAGRFVTKAISEYINGEPLDRISQTFPSAPKVTYNYKAALETGWKFDYKSLLTADTIYITIR